MTFKDFLLEHGTASYVEWVEALTSFNAIGKDMVEDLQYLVQGLKYHPELYVLKHTYLVVQALLREGHYNLLEAGLFHDWGKYRTTYFHNGCKVTSYGHADVSVELFDDIPDELLSTDRELTSWIIKRHMDFDVGHKRFKYSDKYDEPYSELEKFVKADKEDSRQDFYDTVEGEISTVMTRHQKVLQNTYERERNPLTSTTLFLNIGISGSGKSSKVKPYPTISTDEIRKEMMGYVGFDPDIEDQVWETAKNEISQRLREHISVLFDATNVNRYNRVKFLSDIRHRVGIPFRKVGFVHTVDPVEARKRIEKDLADGKDRSDVPMEVINRQYKSLMDSIKEGFTDLNEIR